jgi:hypothetical protein
MKTKTFYTKEKTEIENDMDKFFFIIYPMTTAFVVGVVLILIGIWTLISKLF